MPLLKHSVNHIYRPFIFFEEILSCRYPYGSYKQVFVDQVFLKLIFNNIKILYLTFYYIDFLGFQKFVFICRTFYFINTNIIP